MRVCSGSICNLIIHVFVFVFIHLFSRKLSLLICCVLFVVAAALFLTCRLAQSIELLILGRILAGLASGLTTTVLPMYLIELAPLSLSGTMGVLCSMGVTGGVVVGQVFSLRELFGSDDLWHFALAFYALLVIAAFCTYRWWPESPKYLYAIAGEKERAKQGEMIFNWSNLMHSTGWWECAFVCFIMNIFKGIL